MSDLGPVECSRHRLGAGVMRFGAGREVRLHDATLVVEHRMASGYMIGTTARIDLGEGAGHELFRIVDLPVGTFDRLRAWLRARLEGTT